MRVLVWIAVVVLVYMALRSRARAMQASLRKSAQAEFDAQAAAGQSAPASQQRGQVEDMVACAYCQVYLPVSEAISAGGHSFCSQEHVHLYAVSPPST